MRIGITCYPAYGGSGVVATELGLALAVGVGAFVGSGLYAYRGYESLVLVLPAFLVAGALCQSRGLHRMLVWFLVILVVVGAFAVPMKLFAKSLWISPKEPI